jgi:hypothetical protein
MTDLIVREKKTDLEMAEKTREVMSWLTGKVEQLQLEVKELRPAADKYRQFLDSDGFIDAAEASAIIRLKYINPAGKTEIMGRNYFLNVLCRDGYILETASGYRFTSRYEKSGIGVTRVVTRNDRVRSVCLFNAVGLDRLIEKYQKDTRCWYSTTDHDLYWE